MAFSISTKKKTGEEEEKSGSKSSYKLELTNVTLMQVVSDDFDNSYRPVIGGYQFANMDSRQVIKFKAVGQYMFVAHNTDSSNFCPPIRIKVLDEQPIALLVNDDGFLPKVIRIDEGSTLKWSWTKLAYPHSIYESEYCDEHCSLFRTSKK